MKKLLAVLLAVCLLSGCSTGGQAGSSQPVTSSIATPDTMFTHRDSRTEYTDGIAIRLGETVTADDPSVGISGNRVTVTREGTYLVSGTLEDGMLTVDAPDTAKIQLVLENAHITSTDSAPLYIKEADKVFVTLVGENSLTGGDSFTPIDENNIDGTVFSKQDLTFNGTGSLTVSSPAGHGMVCKDDLVLAGGSFTVTSAGHGIQANDSIRIKDTTLTVNAGKDGLHAENDEDAAKGFFYLESGTLSLESQGDGISAGAWLTVADGTVEILAGGGYENGTKEQSDGFGKFGGGMPPGGGMRPGDRGPRNMSAVSVTEESATSMKGIKSEGELLISGGVITVDSADDGVHSNTSVTLSGGTLTVASGDDGVHAEDTLTVTGGSITVTQSYEGLEGLHIELKGGDIAVTADDDGLNAAGGTDGSGTDGRDGMFGRPGGMFGSGNGSILIAEGTLSITASGDGIDANGTLEITGGYTTVMGPTAGDTATLDYDKTGTISGGTFIGTGAANMAQTFSDSAQGVLAVSVGSQAAGTAITVTDKAGNLVLSHTPALPYQVLILSCPALKTGETYTLTVGSVSGDCAAA